MLWQLLRETGQMDKMFHPLGKSAKNATLQLSNVQWLELDRTLTGNIPKTPMEAMKHFATWRARASAKRPERELLKEIHAYWVSEFVSAEDLYRHLYHSPHSVYQNLYRVSEERFTVLCQTMDWLYAVFDGDFHNSSRFIGNADSIDDFERKSEMLIDRSSRGDLEQRIKQMWREKEQWHQATKQMAKAF